MVWVYPYWLKWDTDEQPDYETYIPTEEQIMTKQELIEDIQFRLTTIIDLNGKDSVEKNDVAKVCYAFCKDTGFQVADVIEEAESYWTYLQDEPAQQ